MRGIPEAVTELSWEKRLAFETEMTSLVLRMHMFLSIRVARFSCFIILLESLPLREGGLLFYECTLK
jgi:hypothetical protein